MQILLQRQKVTLTARKTTREPNVNEAAVAAEDVEAEVVEAEGVLKAVEAEAPPEGVAQTKTKAKSIDLRGPPTTVGRPSGQTWQHLEGPWPDLLQIQQRDTYCLKPQVPVGGRLSLFLPFWQSITTDQWVLQVVKHGYRLEFESPPVSTGRRKTVLQLGEYDMSGEVSGLYDNCSVRYVPPDQVDTGVYSTYFLVDKKDGGKRLILNLKTLNRCLVKRPFKMETLSSIAPVLQLNTWMASIDLKDAYLHVPIFRGHWRFLRFFFKGQDLEFTVTPFGLSPAPMLFTRLVLAIVAWLRLRGIRIHAYLDDILLLGSSPEEVVHALQVTIHAFTSAGFIINIQKSDLTPSQDLVYIGGRFCTRIGRVLLPTDRRDALIRVVQTFFRVGARHPARS